MNIAVTVIKIQYIFSYIFVFAFLDYVFLLQGADNHLLEDLISSIFLEKPEINILSLIILLVFPSISHNQCFVIAKRNQSKDGSILRLRLFFALDLFAF